MVSDQFKKGVLIVKKCYILVLLLSEKRKERRKDSSK